jgi:arginyl-tRNA synthetase
MRLQDLIQIIKDHVRDKLRESKSIDDAEMEEIARKVGLSALKYGDLSNQVTKDYVFDMDRFASFEGNTGPYILYTVVRIKSILRKAADEALNNSSMILEPSGDTERDLMLKLSKFNEVMDLSFKDRAPNRICEYVYDVSNLFNKFYHENKIISEEDAKRKLSWINLITLTKNILETCLDLLGIEAPDKM